MKEYRNLKLSRATRESGVEKSEENWKSSIRAVIN
jgi:hypothetical protein